MKRDPLEALDQFYEACKSAPVPAAKIRRRASLAVPIIGLASGFAVALALAQVPVQPGPETVRHTAEVLTARQYREATTAPVVATHAFRAPSRRAQA